MKKTLTIITMTLFLGIIAGTASLLAQWYPTTGITTLKAGYFDPSASQAGFIFGGGYAWKVDESVDVGIAVDYFRKTHSEDSVQVLADEKLIITNAELTTNIIPIYGLINVKFPAGFKMDYFLSGGIGYEMLFRTEQTYGPDASKKSRFYDGFKWILAAGINYRIGSRSSFIVEAFYDGTKVSRDKKGETSGLARYEVDLSGFGIRAGIRMGL
ncbi:hypothetical protein L0Z72_08445 [candidate division KSB1 bacterium]|nr:hypothetical protein [candidate division KSB1 bacterium]